MKTFEFYIEVSVTDYSNYDAPFPEIEIPLKGADYSLFELNLNSTKQPYPNPIGAIADTDFEDHTVAKLSANLVKIFAFLFTPRTRGKKLIDVWSTPQLDYEEDHWSFGLLVLVDKMKW